MNRQVQHLHEAKDREIAAKEREIAVSINCAYIAKEWRVIFIILYI